MLERANQHEQFLTEPTENALHAVPPTYAWTVHAPSLVHKDPARSPFNASKVHFFAQIPPMDHQGRTQPSASPVADSAVLSPLSRACRALQGTINVQGQAVSTWCSSTVVASYSWSKSQGRLQGVFRLSFVLYLGVLQ